MDKKEIIDFINWALTHSVDYVYVLEDLIDMLEGTKTTWNPEHYMDY